MSVCVCVCVSGAPGKRSGLRIGVAWRQHISRQRIGGNPCLSADLRAWPELYILCVAPSYLMSLTFVLSVERTLSFTCNKMPIIIWKTFVIQFSQEGFSMTEWQCPNARVVPERPAFFRIPVVPASLLLLWVIYVCFCVRSVKLTSGCIRNSLH